MCYGHRDKNVVYTTIPSVVTQNQYDTSTNLLNRSNYKVPSQRHPSSDAVHFVCGHRRHSSRADWG